MTSFAFSFAWFSASFSFPLLAIKLGYSYIIVGFLGFLGALSFPVVSLLYLRARIRAIRLGIILPIVALFALLVALYLIGFSLFLVIAIFAAIVQAFWWISMEISLPLLDAEKGPERYSAGWGIPNAVAPLIAGYLIEYYGFHLLFLLSALVFIASLLFIPRISRVDQLNFQGKISILYAASIFFAGLFSGFIYFVLEPILKVSGVSYSEVGLIVSIYGIMAAAGYIILNYTRDYSIRTFSILSSILIFPTFILGFSLSFPFLMISVILSGFGVSIAMTKVLSYLTAKTSPRKAIFVYETTFGAGFMAGSLGISVLVQSTGMISAGMIFILPLIYAIFLLFRGSERTSGP
ncbi:MAG: MFS transporter [Thermoplasmataceae archaeon]